MAENIYRTVVGFIAFDPREAQANGKAIRQFTLRHAGVKDQAVDVSCTLWPEFDSVDIQKGDAVLVEGKFSQREAQGNDGRTRVFNNLSVSNIVKLGEAVTGRPVGVENAVASDDALPF